MRWCLSFVLTVLCVTPIAAQTTSDFFRADRLQEIHLDLHPADWQRLRTNFLENTYYAADMRWLYEGKVVSVEQTAVRSRGTGSRSGVKPGLLLDFDRYNSNRRFLGLRSVVLRNNGQDASMLRERVAFEFMRRMGIPVPRIAHARVFVNGQYMGVYSLVESIDESFLGDRFDDENAYLYEYDYGREDLPYFMTYRGPDSALYSPKPFQPQTHESDSQPERIVAMIRTINEVSDPQFNGAVSEFLDLKLFVTGLAVEAYLAEQDGIIGDYGLNNFYLYRHPDSNRFQFLPWDKSQTFITVARSPWTNVEHYPISRRALAIPELKSIFVTTLVNSALVAGGPGGWIEQEILREYELIRQAVLEDPYKQCDPQQSGILRACTNAEFETSVMDMLRFVRERNSVIAQHLRQELQALPTFGFQSFSLPGSGGAAFQSSGTGLNVVSGHAQLEMNSSTLPGQAAGLVFIGFRQNKVLVSETTVPAVAPLRAGRIYAESAGSVRTGVAIANSNPRPVVVAFYFTDSSGRDFGHGSVTIPQEGQIARFLDEAPFNGGAHIDSTFTFNASLPIGVVALRGFTNERSEFLLTTLPVADLFTVAPAPSIIPHYAQGGGWSTHIMLVNPGDYAISGIAEFWDTGQNSANGEIVRTLPYSVPPRGSFRLTLTGVLAGIETGWVRLSSGDRLPMSMSLLSFQTNGVTVTQAGAPGISESSSFRMYVETGKALESGVAIVNPAGSPAVVDFELTALTGVPAGIRGTFVVTANNQIPFFLGQLPGFQPVPPNFQGILHLSSSSSFISVIGLRGRYNERGDFLIAATPPTPDGGFLGSEISIPLVVDSGGYESQIILYSAHPGPVVGNLRYRDRNGDLLDLRMKQ